MENKLIRLLNSKSKQGGLAVTEYAMQLAVVALIAVSSLNFVGTTISSPFARTEIGFMQGGGTNGTIGDEDVNRLMAQCSSNCVFGEGENKNETQNITETNQNITENQ